MTQEALESGTYEIIRDRLNNQTSRLQTALSQLNDDRKQAFGAIETKLLANQRITTENNCVPRDMVPIGRHFIFGYNVHLGLRSETNLADVFAVYLKEDGHFQTAPLDILKDARFIEDFKNLYKYYKDARFYKFALIGPHLFMVFRVGKRVADIKTFKWILKDGVLTYADNRSDHEFTYPPQHEFQWVRATRDMHRQGRHPHIAIEDRLFVETVGGDLTIKVEDNTESGEGIYAEPVEDTDQILDDADISYVSMGHVILLRIKPYQEKEFRYLVYNEKLREVRRIDAIEDACVLLPDGHGLIFPRGYYLLTGEYKEFDNALQGMSFERRIPSPNGEDYLYVFYHRENGDYILLSYNIIEQSVQTPIICNGYSIFENGRLIYFRSEEEPQKHHAVQIWQTPYVGPDFEIAAEGETELSKIGNKDIVRCMAECNEVMALCRKEDSYENLYVDIVKKAGDVLDSYFWLKDDAAHELDNILEDIRQTAQAAIEEFDKVTRIKKATAGELKRVTEKSADLMRQVRHGHMETVNDFVKLLAELRTLRGEIISTKERRYVDMAQVEKLEKEVGEQVDHLSQKCVGFLLEETALDPYRNRVEKAEKSIDELKKVSDAKALGEEIDQIGRDLELLIEIVSNLKIEDATQTTRIIDTISAIYADLNRGKAALKNKRKRLAEAEGVAEFNAQMKLLGQGLVNFLDVCDSPDKCEMYLTKLMVQVEELEARFSEFDEFIGQLAEKREEIYNAFEARRLQLVESRNKRASSLFSAAERILNGIRSRASQFKEVNDINGYFAGDLMIEKVRDIVKQLQELEDTVKADDIQSRLKTIREEAVRQLKDKLELFADGENIIKFGKHKFSVNTQEPALTMVRREDGQFFHLTGTDFFEKVDDPGFLATADVWDLDVPSETKSVYRAEFLAYTFLQSLESGNPVPVDQAAAWDEATLLEEVRRFMGPRYEEGYAKGVHDEDAAKMLETLIALHQKLGMLTYPPEVRASAALFWESFCPKGPKANLETTFAGLGTLYKLFPKHPGSKSYVAEIKSLLDRYLKNWELFPENSSQTCAEFLFRVLLNGGGFPISYEAAEIYNAFIHYLKHKHVYENYQSDIKNLKGDPAKAYTLTLDWVHAFLHQHSEFDAVFATEVATLLYCNLYDHSRVCDVGVSASITGLKGSHDLLEEGSYQLNYSRFTIKLAEHCRTLLPKYRAYRDLKKQLTETFARDLRLEEFKPRVLTSFVRNKLIDQVYLPLIGDNLAKQMGTAGENKRTDRMGMLLLISPPGYGKTTLMEYIASRLGLIFMKINGPAIGHDVTSLDPTTAPNSAAREELKKLNLALEMGDNIMLYLDDIQHCNPEFLQKFISLCDGQRRIEGVYKGRPRTYDLRGKKVAVVMAGNPYTESGDKFQIPDMLANRADTYNLGDIIGDKGAVFELSYIENCLTSNSVLDKLNSRGQKDLYALIRVAESGSQEGLELEANYSSDEVNEIVSVLRKLLLVRDIVLKVNLSYIASAAQEDAYRTEPPFKLQGSYRNMAKIAEKIQPIMNDEELKTLMLAHYESESQTLTTGAEANMLKFKELVGWMTDTEKARWSDIKATFQKQQRFHGLNTGDSMGQVLAQLSMFGDGLESIRDVLAQATKKDKSESKAVTRLAPETLIGLQELMQNTLSQLPKPELVLPTPPASRPPANPTTSTAKEDQEEQDKQRRFLIKVLRHQFDVMNHWLLTLYNANQDQNKEIDKLQAAVKASLGTHKTIIDHLKTLVSR